MPRLFDAYIMVDWSAASSPTTGKDSIWIADLRASTGRVSFDNPPTRAAATDILERRLAALTDARRRTLLGFDFSLGYPAGTARAIGLAGTAWHAMYMHLADTIKDEQNNANNRFEVAANLNAKMAGDASPFWGVTSQRHVAPSLAAKKPAQMPLPEFRIVEQYLRSRKLGSPKSVWQLAYIGSVGSQSLMGIPRVHKLQQKFPQARLWPFETGFQALTPSDLQQSKIVIAEIYPSLVNPRRKENEPLDKSQVRAIARHYWEMDKSGTLSAAFAPPDELNTEDLSIINAEEGWILGISPINIGNLAS